MASIIVRNLPDSVRDALRVQAARHSRSMEAEARAILEESLSIVPFLDGWLTAADALRGTEIRLAERDASVGRHVDLA